MRCKSIYHHHAHPEIAAHRSDGLTYYFAAPNAAATITWDATH